ncbi:MAG: pyridoxal-phosphate dependent enzyme [Cyclobacteriaceae bacterium]|nr:pyridoxal-phosphate dependent enzyme [Cyclobacteriaceae bacterium]
MYRTLSYTSTPITELKSDVFAKSEVRVLLKREDLNNPYASGNKWWKLKYNLEEAERQGYETLLTFGGAYSNHIFATAAAGKELGLKTIGVIRGEEVLPLNYTLAFAESCGMKLHYISREAYRKKTESDFIEQLHHEFGNFYLIPEGGTNELAIKGCAELAHQLQHEVDFDYLCLSIGTGGTMAGMIEGLEKSKRIIGFSSLKGGAFLEEEIRKMILPESTNWSINTDYHFGGYGKTSSALKFFINHTKANHQLSLDIVYTSKMFFGVVDLITKGYFKRKSTVLVLHTGGLQGNSNEKEKGY